MTKSQRDVLAHLGAAILSAQIVERFTELLLTSPTSPDSKDALQNFVSWSGPKRQKALRDLLAELRSPDRSVLELDADLRSFAVERNKIVHCFHEIQEWAFYDDQDCAECVSFLRAFIDKAASLQHVFVSVQSVRDVHYGTSVAVSRAKQYADDFKRVYAPLLAIRWETHDGA